MGFAATFAGNAVVVPPREFGNQYGAVIALGEIHKTPNTNNNLQLVIIAQFYLLIKFWLTNKKTALTMANRSTTP